MSRIVYRECILVRLCGCGGWVGGLADGVGLGTGAGAGEALPEEAYLLRMAEKVNCRRYKVRISLARRYCTGHATLYVSRWVRSVTYVGHGRFLCS